MEPVLILYPVFALAALTFGITIWLGKLRFLAVKRGDLSPKYYSFNRGADMPECLAKVNQNYDSLLELPILFYVVVILIYITNTVDFIQLILAWLFVSSSRKELMASLKEWEMSDIYDNSYLWF